MTEQRVAIVTGASRGIGAATAFLAAKGGYSVCVNYNSGKREAEQVVKTIQENGAKAIAVQADISSEPDVMRLFEIVDEKLGRVQSLVNNAGIVAKQHRLDEVKVEQLNRMFAINAIGSMLCAREAVRRMSTRHGGHGGAIVNVSSRLVSYGSAGEFIEYAASKGAIDVFTLGLAREVAEEGIRVNAVRPGLVRTDLHLQTGEPGRLERYAPSIPMRRAGEPEEVAATILWLMSDEASYVTGSVLDVGGGR